MILLVDDNKISRDIVRKWLENAGFHSHAIVDATSGGLAFNVFMYNADRVQAVLTDVMFNETQSIKDGVELVELIRQFEQDTSTEKPVYILAFSSDSKFAALILEAGGDMFLQKPLKRQQIVELVKAHYVA